MCMTKGLGFSHWIPLYVDIVQKKKNCEIVFETNVLNLLIL